MFFKKNAGDIMIPIENYSVTSIDKTLREAVLEMKKVYCEVESGKCTEAGHRTSLVLNEYGHVAGIIDFPSVLRTLMPDIFERVHEKMMSPSEAGFVERVFINAEVQVSSIMLKVRGTLNIDDNLLAALKVMLKNRATVLPVYKGGKLVGVLRDSDLFLAAAGVLTD